ncbi:MAG: hypothetical protein EBW15_08285, partial [Actinobacteria bacterium]|nr:hypothetical protein [Actinomycetota bacterium]
MQFFEWVLRPLVNPGLIWALLFLLLLIRSRRRGINASKVIATIFILFSILLSSPLALYFASRPLENFAIEKFRYADASARNGIPCNEYAGVIALGGVIPNSDFNEVNGIQL